jgi:hypothetical protein
MRFPHQKVGPERSPILQTEGPSCTFFDVFGRFILGGHEANPQNTPSPSRGNHEFPMENHVFGGPGTMVLAGLVKSASFHVFGKFSVIFFHYWAILGHKFSPFFTEGSKKPW